ncbi:MULTISPECIES: DUF2920 family protein [Campylobacter]|uniref:DUF2920 family protein n=1 Tax=Campylobacter TaxID=194 RepID=UPI000A33A233|nr:MULTISPECIES: DUF2920 family protein [unclassified Campylobacter]MCR8679183.1 DUF2920 family protein [Campylobacter sp. RM19072]MCR8696689.1 DUF2920 family protein [Campylobacter sp. RM19073]
MIQTKTYKIDGVNDAELGIKRKSKLEFKLTYDNKKEIRALIAIIPGLGEDGDSYYRQKLAQSIARDLDAAVVTTNYFAVRSNPPAAKFSIDEIDELILRTVAQSINRPIPDDVELTKMGSDEIWEYLNSYLYNFIGMQKVTGKLKLNFKLPFHLTLAPPNDEYQNFGLMASLDVVNATLYAQSNPPFKVANLNGGGLAKIYVGSSHGGYIANLCAKYAPWAVDAILDNCGWNLSTDIFDKENFQPGTFRTIGFGKEIDFMHYRRDSRDNENFHLCVSDKTKWTSNSQSPNYFSRSRYEIRDLNEPSHLITQAKYPKPIFKCYHVKDDAVAPVGEKIKFYEQLKNLGFDVTLDIISDKSRVDGKFIKNIEHGMGMSMKLLVANNYEWIMDKIAKNKKPPYEPNIEFKTSQYLYKFSQKDNQVSLKCTKITD